MCRGVETTYRVRFVAMTVGVLTVACLASRAASAGPIIHEVFYDAVGSDTGQVFTEIYGEAGMSLSGWSLVGINGSSGLPYRSIDLTGAVIPADSLLVIAQSSATPLLAGFRDFVANVDWQNGPDAVQFLDPWGRLADALQYGDAGLHNAGEGTFAFDAAAGSSLTRDLLGSDTNDNGIDFSAGIPSPGLGPPPLPPNPIPEPPTMLLLCSGLVGGYWCRRRRAGR